MTKNVCLMEINSYVHSELADGQTWTSSTVNFSHLLLSQSMENKTEVIE